MILINSDARERERIEKLLNMSEDLRCAGNFSSAGEALLTIAREHVDIAVVDLTLPDLCGIRFVEELRTRAPGTRALLTMSLRWRIIIEQAVHSGAEHCLIKPVRAAQLLATLRSVLAKLACRERLAADNEPWPFVSPLNLRETELMRCLAEGMYYKEAADALGASEAMVKKWQHAAYRKLRAQNRTEAINHWREFRIA